MRSVWQCAIGSVAVVVGEQLAGGLIMALLGGGLVAVGMLGRRGRVDFALGGWTPDTASPDSWAAAHATIGAWFVAAGLVAAASAVAIVLSPSTWTGPLVVGGSVLLLVLVVVGVVRGTNRLRAR
jgi:hypothetical protein